MEGVSIVRSDRLIGNRGRDLAILLSIPIVWIIAEWIIDPRGDFPLNDDWAFGISVQRMLAGDGFQPGPLPQMSLFSHVVWGALVCLPFECSFQILRTSTILTGVISTYGTYFLLREVGSRRDAAAIGAYSVGFNPLHVVLANSFMTDIPFMAITTVAMLFYIRFIRTRCDRWLVVGTVLAIVATLSRQIAIAIPIALAFTLIWSDGLRRTTWSRILLPSTAAILAFVTLELFLWVNGTLPEPQKSASTSLLLILYSPFQTIRSMIGQGSIMVLYFGWFLLPVLLLVPVDRVWRHLPSVTARVLTISGTLALGLLGTWAMVSTGHLMPSGMNVIVPQGIGPLTLHDSYPYGSGTLNLHSIPDLPALFWMGISIISVVGAMMLAFASLAWLARLATGYRVKLESDDLTQIFLIMSCLLYLGPAMIINWYDRYLLPAVPWVLAFLCMTAAATETGRGRYFQQSASVAVLCITAIFSVAGTGDYLAWNRARWIALSDLLVSGVVTPGQVDGGLEFNGMHFGNKPYQPVPGKSWWWVIDDLYVVALGPIPGWPVAAEYPYRSWLHPGVGRILVLKHP